MRHLHFICVLLFCGLTATVARGQQNTDAGPWLDVITLPETPPPARSVISEPRSPGMRLSTNELDLFGIDKPAALLELGGGVAYGPMPGFAALGLRGASDSVLSAGLAPRVGLLVDGMPYRNSGFITAAMLDLESAEILRGAHGQAFGRDATDGLIRLQTADAVLDAGSASIAGGRGSLGDRHARGMINLPVFDEALAARLSFGSRQSEAVAWNTARDEASQSALDQARLKLNWRMLGSGQGSLSLARSVERIDGVAMQWSKLSPELVDSLELLDPQLDRNSTDLGFSSDLASYSEHEAQSAQLSYSQGLDRLQMIRGLKLKFLAGWARSENPWLLDLDGTVLPLASLGTLEPEIFEQHHAELSLTGSSEVPFDLGLGMDWVAGVSVAREQLDASRRSVQAPQLISGLQDLLIGVPELSAINDLLDATQETLVDLASARSDSETRSMWISNRWRFTDRIDASSELRVDQLSTSYLRGTTNQPGLPGRSKGLALAVPVANHSRETLVSPAFKLGWAPRPGLALQARIAQAWRSGGISGPQFLQLDAPASPERTRSFELSLLLGDDSGAGQATLTGFISRIDDARIAIDEGLDTRLIDSGPVRRGGLELDFGWQGAGGLLGLSGQASWMTESWSPLDAALGAGPQSPELIASLRPVVRLMPDSLGLALGATIAHVGEHRLAAGVPSTEAASTRFDLHVLLGAPQRSWSVKLRASNLGSSERRELVRPVPGLDQALSVLSRPVGALYTVDLRYAFGG